MLQTGSRRYLKRKFISIYKRKVEISISLLKGYLGVTYDNTNVHPPNEEHIPYTCDLRKYVHLGQENEN